jgi:CubicO group peptidase (beta-lactamase class C family)
MPRAQVPLRRHVTVSITCAAVLVALVVAGAIYRPDRALRASTGTAAHDLCSETFVSQLDPEQVFAESLAPRPGLRWIAWAMQHRVDPSRREAHASLLGALPSRAVFRDGIGCVLVHGNEPIATVKLEGIVHAAPLLPAIAGPVLVEPAEPRLRAALDTAFLEPQQPPHRHTKAVVIVHDGSVIAERYAEGYGINTPILGFSMTKSVTNALVGILVRERRLARGAPAPIAAWQNDADPRRAVTIEQLMRMNSGLALDETGSGFDPSNQMFYDEPDMAGYAQRAALIAAPATRWSYSSASTHLLARIVRDRVGGTADAVQRFAFRELFDLLGMRSVTLEMDATGTPIGAHYMLASARDWARFGSLYLNDGVVGGRRILPEGWVQLSTAPTLGTAYGAGWWTNRGADPAARHRVDAGIPVDAFFAMGNLGQRIAVIPSERLVIVRMARAHLPHGDMAGFEKLIVDTIASLHRKQ